MSRDHTERNKQTVRRFYAELDRHRFDVIDELVAEDFVDHAAPPGHPPGRAGVRAFYQRLYAAFPDLETLVLDLIAEGDKVVLRKTANGTHRGTAFFGLPALGRRLELEIINVFRVDEQGRLNAHWHAFDTAAVARQLGRQ